MRVQRKAAWGGDGDGEIAGSIAPGKRTRAQSLPPIVQAKAAAPTAEAPAANHDALANTFGHDLWAGGGAVVQRKAADWGATYGGASADPVSQNGKTASAYKASINTEGGAVLAPASDVRNTGGKPVHRSVFRLTRAEMLEILTTAWTAGGLDYRLKQGEQSPDENRKHAEAELEKYIGYCKNALETMMIDTVEAQALFLGHSAGETAFAKMTEGQLDSNQFEDTPAEVKVSTSTAATTEERYKDGTRVMDGPMRYRQPQSPHRGTVDPLGAIDGSDENSFDKTFIGRGSIQVTHKAGYVQALMFMEKRVEDLRAQAAANEFPATKAELTKQADDLEEATNAIKTDPSNAANPRYAFLFSAAHMQASPMVRNSAGGYTEAGMSGGAKDRQKSRKELAYGKAYEILMRHRDEDAQPRGPTAFDHWDAGPGCVEQ